MDKSFNPSFSQLKHGLMFFFLIFCTAEAWSELNSSENVPKIYVSPSIPLYEVNTLGAATSGDLVEGICGARQKGVHGRFACHSEGPKPGFLGPITVAKPTSIRCQPGIFPAPLAGPASLTFTFSCQGLNSITPIVIRPDGTALQGFPMTEEDFPQTIVVASPAQTGIYTLFVLPHCTENQNAFATVDVTTSTNLKQSTRLYLRAFETVKDNEDKVSAEFIYSPLL